MARREGNGKQIMGRLADALCETILRMEPGTKASIGELASRHYESLGYEPRHLGIDLGWGWTKDGGMTYVITDEELFTVLELVRKKLDGRRVLDFSAYEDRVVGLPYNLDFTVKAE